MVIGGIGGALDEGKEAAAPAAPESAAPAAPATTTEAEPPAEETPAVKEPDAEEPAPVEEPASEPITPEIPGTLDITPEEFETAFNTQSERLNATISIDQLDVEEGPVQNVSQYAFSDDLVMTGTVNKADGSMRDVMILTQAKSEQSAGNFINILGLVILATSPNSDMSLSKTVGAELGIFEKGVNFSTIDNETVQGGVRYHIQGSPQVGLMFSAGDPNEK